MDYFLDDSPAVCSHQKQRVFELKANRAAQKVLAKAIKDLIEEEAELKEILRADLRQSGIYEAHLRGVRAEEIAHYGDYSVGYVERCIQYKKMEEYSRRTGNAIIIQWPEE